MIPTPNIAGLMCVACGTESLRQEQGQGLVWCTGCNRSWSDTMLYSILTPLDIRSPPNGIARYVTERNAREPGFAEKVRREEEELLARQTYRKAVNDVLDAVFSLYDRGVFEPKIDLNPLEQSAQIHHEVRAAILRLLKKDVDRDADVK